MATKRPYAPATREAAELLGARVRLARRRRRWTVQELADRIGVTRATVAKVERGDPSVGLGVAFEAASLLGVVLFDPDQNRRSAERSRVNAELAMLPAAVRKTGPVNDDF